jgi:dolichol-phosphate mannosyltransferase
MAEKPQLSILAPLYNEEESLPLLVARLNKLMDESPLRIEVVLVNDGSKDKTEDMMRQLALADSRYHCVFLARNYGHQLALSAGMSVVNGTEGVMVIDGDLQDPPELLGQFYELLKQGNDVVYAVRKKRKEGILKRAAYHLFYRLLKKISYIDIPLDSGDFCLMNRRIVDILNKMPEESRYIRGMRSWIGFKQVGLEYERDERQAGTSKYSFALLWKLAYNGIFNFSEFPIKLVSRIGVFVIIFSIMYLIGVLLKKLIYGTVPEGFITLFFIISLFSGIQLISLGLIGEYILRIFFQTKGRPLFIIKDRIENKVIKEG